MGGVLPISIMLTNYCPGTGLRPQRGIKNDVAELFLQRSIRIVPRHVQLRNFSLMYMSGTNRNWYTRAP